MCLMSLCAGCPPGLQKKCSLFRSRLLSFSLACGSSGSRSNPPVKGNFSNASLIGQYTYSLSGTSEISNTNSFASYTEAGWVNADGKGKVRGGTGGFSQK